MKKIKVSKYEPSSYKWKIELLIEGLNDDQIKSRLNEVKNGVYYRLIIDFLLIVIFALGLTISLIFLGNDHIVTAIIGCCFIFGLIMTPFRIKDFFNRRWEESRLEQELYIRRSNKKP